jgi:putative DNA primase/helicase
MASDRLAQVTAGRPSVMRAAEIAEHIGAGWPAVLEQLGIEPQFLRNVHGPCPACGGTDRYRFDNKGGRGGYYCSRCGAGDGFKLLQRVHGWDFRTARDRVIEAAGLSSHNRTLNTVAGTNPVHSRTAADHQPTAQLSARVKRLRTELCRLEDCPDAVAYLSSRGLWPAAAHTTLKAHPSVEYYDAGQRVDRFPALIVDVRDFTGDLVTAHVTYLANGAKLASHKPRKILSPMVGRESCAVRLYRVSGDSMGIAEGLETAIAASVLHDMPTWAALNTSLLAKFKPPVGVDRLVVFADRDLPGITAAAAVLERLQGKVRVEIRTPPAPHKDWNDALTKGTR